jgi:hypothetical protein
MDFIDDDGNEYVGVNPKGSWITMYHKSNNKEIGKVMACGVKHDYIYYDVYTITKPFAIRHSCKRIQFYIKEKYGVDVSC